MVGKKNLILPGNPRYQPKALQDFFGYDNLFRGLARVEIAVLQVLGEIGVIPKNEIDLLSPEMINEILEITTAEVDKIEREITKHDVRAWVRVMQQILPSELRRWAHVPLTSYDALDTGRIIQYSEAYQKALKPMIRQVISEFIGLVRRNAETIQIGRTHGQHALPVTVGFWLATILYRILYNARNIDEFAGQLVGKISGAVGAYNAISGLGIAKRCGDYSFEKRVLDKLGLKASPISTQIIPPEPLAYFLYSCTLLSSSLSQFGRDCRNLMRSEIGEISEYFDSSQVGSSTMAHKRNPINFENLEGMWLRTKSEFGKVLDTLISEHQRDLVGSCVARDFPIILVNLTQQLETLLRKNKSGLTFLSRIYVDSQACYHNFDKSAGLIIAEPLYIALQISGYSGDAHELINRQAVPLAKKNSISLLEAVKIIAENDLSLQRALASMPQEFVVLLGHPENYTGNAENKALEIAVLAEKFLDQ